MTVGASDPLPRTSPTVFQAQYQSVCGGENVGSAACTQYLLNQTQEHFTATNYLTSQYRSLEKSLVGAERDWSFIVGEFGRLGPMVDNFTASNAPTMAMLVNNLSKSVDTFIQDVNPILDWSHETYLTLLQGGSNDTLAFSKEADLAIKQLFNQAVSVAQLGGSNGTNALVRESSSYVDKFFQAEFNRVNSNATRAQSSLLNRISSLQQFLNSTKSSLTLALNAVKANSTDQGVLIAQVIPAKLKTALASLKSQIQESVISPMQVHASADLQRQNAVFANFTNDTFAALQQQANESLADVVTLIHASARDTSQIAGRARSSVEAVFNESQSAFMDAWDDITLLLQGTLVAARPTGANETSARSFAADANGTKSVLIQDSDLGVDSVEQFLAQKEAIESAITQNTARQSSSIEQRKRDIKNAADSTLAQLQTDTDSLTHGNMTELLPAIAAWTNYSTKVYNETLPMMRSKFADALQAENAHVIAELAVFQNKTLNLSDPRFGPIISSQNLTALNSSEFNANDNRTSVISQRISASVETALESAVLALNASGKSAELAQLNVSAEVGIQNVSDTFATLLQAESDGYASMVAKLRDTEIEAPADRVLADQALVEAGLNNLTARVGVVDQNLTRIEIPFNAGRSDLGSSVRTLTQFVDDRTDRVSDSIARSVASATDAANEFKDKWLANLPTASGFAQAALDARTNISQLEGLVKSANADLAQRISANSNQAGAYLKSLIAANSAVGQSTSDLAGINSTRVPDFAALNAAAFAAVPPSALTVNGTNELVVLNGSLTAAVQEAVKVFQSKLSDLQAAVAAANQTSSTRSNELATVLSQTTAKRDAAATIGSAFTDRVIGAIRKINSTIGSYDDEIDTVNISSAAQMQMLSALIAEEIGELRHQVGEAAPEFLSQYEADIVKKLIQRLQSLNRTITAVDSNAMAQFDVGAQGAPSLLHSGGGLTKPSAGLTEIVNSVSTPPVELKGLKEAIANSIAQIKREIALSNSSSGPVVVVGNDISLAGELENATTTVVARFTDSVIKKHSTWDKLMKLRDSSADRLSQGMVDSHTGMVSNVSSVLNHTIALEEEVVRPTISDLQSRVADLHTLGVNGVDKLSLLVNRTTQSSQLPRVVRLQDLFPVGSVNVTFDKSHKVELLEGYVDRAIEGVTMEVDRRIEREFGEVNTTIGKADSVLSRLQRMLQTENKIEKDFDQSILPELKRKTQSVGGAVEEEMKTIAQQIERDEKELRRVV